MIDQSGRGTRLTSDHDEGDTVGQGKREAERVELRLDRRIAIHGWQPMSPPISVFFAANA